MAEYDAKLRDSLLSMRNTCWNLYCENNLYWMSCSKLFMYSEAPFNTWFMSKISEEHHFLFALQLLIDNAEDEDLNNEKQLDIFSDLIPILKQANKLIDEMGGIQSKIIIIGQNELNYCIKHAEAIKKIVSIITKMAESEVEYE